MSASPPENGRHLLDPPLPFDMTPRIERAVDDEQLQLFVNVAAHGKHVGRVVAVFMNELRKASHELPLPYLLQRRQIRPRRALPRTRAGHVRNNEQTLCRQPVKQFRCLSSLQGSAARLTRRRPPSPQSKRHVPRR